ALEDLLALDRHVKVLDLEISHLVGSALSCRVVRSNGQRGRVGARSDAALRERGELRERGLLERSRDAALYPGPEQLRRTVLVAVDLVVAEHAACAGLAEAL